MCLVVFHAIFIRTQHELRTGHVSSWWLWRSSDSESEKPDAGAAPTCFLSCFINCIDSWIFRLVWSQHKIKLSRGMQCCSTSFSTPYSTAMFRSSLEPCVSQASPKSWKPGQISIIYFLAFFFLEGGSTGSAAFPRFLELEPLGSSEGSIFGWLLVFAFGSGLHLALLAGLMFLGWNRLVEILVASWIKLNLLLHEISEIMLQLFQNKIMDPSNPSVRARVKKLWRLTSCFVHSTNNFFRLSFTSLAGLAQHNMLWTLEPPKNTVG